MRSAPPAVSQLLARAGLPARLEPLAGDASTRRYFRVHGYGRTAVLMSTGAPLGPEDDGSGRDGEPFLRWHRFLSGIAIRVPEVLSVDRDAGLVLLEDLGDDLLQRRVEATSPAACAALYLRAVEIGRRLADAGTAAFTPDAADSDDPLVPRRLALEMDLLLAHGAGLDVAGDPPLEAARRALDDAGRGAIREARALLHRLCEDVHAASSGGLVLCHRDYHARNLIVVRAPDGTEDLAVIDFQDTRRGPRAYDLASLAFDPYVLLPDDLVAQLVTAWRPDGVEDSAWRREVDLAAGQRLLKAAGTYIFMRRVRERAEYAQWLAPALRRAFQRLATWTPRDELWRVLAECGIDVP